MKLPPLLEKRLNEPSVPSPTVKAFGATMPGAKLRLLVGGRGVPLGKRVAKPAGALLVLSTVALPASAFAEVGIVTPDEVNCPGNEKVCAGVRAALG